MPSCRSTWACAALLVVVVTAAASLGEEPEIGDRLRAYFAKTRTAQHELPVPEEIAPPPLKRSPLEPVPLDQGPVPSQSQPMPGKTIIEGELPHGFEVPYDGPPPGFGEHDGPGGPDGPDALWDECGCDGLAAGERDDCRLLNRLFPPLGPLSVRGWVSQGYTWNPDNPVNNSNLPVTFNDRAGEYQLNQLYVTLEKPIRGGRCWDLGGRVDVLYGTDYFFTTARGLETETEGSQRWNSDTGPRGAALYGVAMPQAYMEVYAPLAEGLSVKLGHFYTIVGYEVVPAPQNFFYSHSYTMQYGEPFTHTGVLGSLNLAGGLSLQGGMTRGWNTWEDNNDDLGVLAGFSWTGWCDRLSLAFTLHGGREQDEPPDTDNERNVYSMVAAYKVSDVLTYVVQHDRGWEQGAVAGANLRDGDWYGINQYFIWQFNRCLAMGLRYEWFRDEDGTRVPLAGGPAVPADYFGLTLGFNYRPSPFWTVRPEFRWDWVDTEGVAPFNDGGDDTQFLFAVDLIYEF